MERRWTVSVYPSVPAQRAPDLFTFVFAALVSLAPIGGEGRGEGASVDAEANRRRSSGAREDGFRADSAVGARRPPHPNPLPRWGRGNALRGKSPHHAGLSPRAR